MKSAPCAGGVQLSARSLHVASARKATCASPSIPVRFQRTTRDNALATSTSSPLCCSMRRRCSFAAAGLSKSSLFGASFRLAADVAAPAAARFGRRRRKDGGNGGASSPALRRAVRASASAGAAMSTAPQIERMPSFLSGPGLKHLGTGRRKCAIARVCLIEGTGRIVVNGRPGADYLQSNPELVQLIQWPLVSLGYEQKYDVFVKVQGGGIAGQAGAIALGISRALCQANAANRTPLKRQHLLTRDSRVKERRKYGLKKARKAPQFSKR
ncbi:hypothetical protein CBR_g38598 [Chara braunii]|uniref:Small ribosomal subunit protein uS9c n=1 Tax=Chara braunii TaxID=69332 RepID=A0A388K0D8_CHABU|nr:hypothetical protein CBR_g38598 [Chara braunii]|eukprot:GBG63530.1 hypothetical protein CBR_g38598 [Chara braunii]